MNNLENIYKELGENICLFPFLASFYGTSIEHTLTPCSLTTGAWPIDDQSILQTINNSQWKTLRKNFIEGSCHTSEYCDKCSRAEQLGSDSARILNNKYFSEHLSSNIVAEVKRIIANDYTIDKILSFDYFPSNYCNYECIMCCGSASSARRTFEIKINKQTVDLKNIDVTDDFYQIIEQVEILNFTGGETILQPQVHKLLDYLIEKDAAKNITISMLTNISSYPENMIDKFKQFKNVFYTLSIDGIGDVAEYQRRGTVWANVEVNALRMWNNFGCVVNYVLTAVNVFRFDDFLEWIYKHKINTVFISVVFNSLYLSVESIPDELKIPLIEKLINLRGRYTEEPYNDLLEKVINILSETKHNPYMLEAFKDQILKENTASKLSLIEVIPEWKPYFE